MYGWKPGHGSFPERAGINPSHHLNDDTNKNDHLSGLYVWRGTGQKRFAGGISGIIESIAGYSRARSTRAGSVRISQVVMIFIRNRDILCLRYLVSYVCDDYIASVSAATGCVRGSHKSGGFCVYVFLLCGTLANAMYIASCNR